MNHFVQKIHIEQMSLNQLNTLEMAANFLDLNNPAERNLRIAVKS